MDLDSDALPDASTGSGRAASTVASEHGAETPGFVGAAHKAGAGQAARLTTRFEIMFGGPRTPMIAPNVLISAVGGASTSSLGNANFRRVRLGDTTYGRRCGRGTR